MLEMLIVVKLIQDFPTFCVNVKIIAVLRRVLYYLRLHLLYIHFSIIFPSVLKSLKRSLVTFFD
jgi:hypothetical protein